MSTTIDHKIVELLFKNKDFEKNAADSIKTIDTLKKKLTFEDSIRSIGVLADSLKNVSFQQMSDGITSIASGFNATGAIVFGVIQNMVNAAINAGRQITNALYIDPVKLGFQEYETQMNSVQTILANTQKENTTLEVVMAALDELNQYADKTIYNFTQMTRNIGTFTAAGVKLDSSVQAIKGIANLAAISGSNADQASTAMYQLSQALSSGTVRLMDWNSVVNAGMGGQVFQDALTETARVHGVAIDDILKKEGSFRDSLQTGWLTSEILTETLSKFTGDLTADQLRALGYTEEQIEANLKLGKMASDAATKVKTFTQLFDTLKEAAQSGWSKTWQIVIGDFEEAKEFMTELNEIFGSMISETSDARNNFLEGWDSLGGRTELIQSFRNVLASIQILIEPISEALREIFPPMTYQEAYRLTKALTAFTEKLKMGEETVDKVKRIFKGFFSLLDIGRMAISAIAKGIGILFSSLAPSANNFFDILANAGDYITNLRDGLKEADTFNNIVQNMASFIGSVLGRIKEFFNVLKNGFEGFKTSFDDSKFEDFISTLKDKFKPLSGMISFLGTIISNIGKIISIILPFFIKLGSIAADGFNSFVESITKGLDKFDPEKAFAVINEFLFGGFLLGITKFIEKGSGLFGDIGDILGSVRGSLEAWQSNLKADTLLKLAAAVGILALSILTISLIDSVKLTSSLAAMTAMFIQLIGALTVLDKTSKLNPASASAITIGLIGLSTAILILGVALERLGKMDSEELVRGMIAITAMSSMLILVGNLLSKSSGNMIIGATSLVIFSYALTILSDAVSSLGKLNTNELTNGLIGIGVLLAGISLFLKNTNLGSGGIKGALSLLIVGAALNIIVLAVKNISSLEPEKMMQGLVGIGTILGAIMLFTNNVANSSNLLVASVGLTILSGALFVMSLTIEKLAGISWEGLAKGLAGIAGSLFVIIIALSSFPPNIMMNALSLVVISGALLLMAESMVKMGSMSWEEIGRGLSVLAGSLTILALAMYAMTASLPGAAALIIAAGALLMLAPALKVLGSMSLEEIGIAMLALAATFVILGVAGSVLTPVVPTLLALGGAMLLIGLGAAAVGVGVLAFSAGLTALAASGAAGASALVLIITSIVSLVPMILKQLGKSLIILIDTIAAGAPAILEGLVTIALALIDGLYILVPKIVDLLYTLIEKLLTTLAEKLPIFVEAGYEIILAILNGIKENIGEIVVTAISIVTNFIDGVASMLPQLVDSAYSFVVDYINAISAGVEENLPLIMEALRGLGLSIAKGLLNGLIDGRKQILDGIWELATILIDEFKRILGISSPSTIFYELASFIISGLTNGLLTNSVLAIDAIRTMISKLIESFSERLNEFMTFGILFVENFISGIVDTAITLYNVVLTLISSAILIVTNKYSEIRQLGIEFVLGFVSGLNDYINRVISSANSLTNSFIDAIRSKYEEVRDAGINLVLGFISGINDYISDAVQAAYDLASSVIEVIEDVLNISSPSKVLYIIGKFISLGLSKGISESSYLVKKTIDDLSNDSVYGFNDMLESILNIINGELDFNPVISPVLDLSDIEKKSQTLNSLLKTRPLMITTSSNIAGSIGSSIQNGSGKQEEIDIKKDSEKGSEVTFNQYNYSPEPLSRLEIYRQTRIQLNLAKGVVKIK